MQAALEQLLRKRRDRSIAIILGFKEREVDRHLPPQVQAKLRKVVLDQFNEFFELIHDVAGSLDNGEVVLNEEYLGKIDEMHAALANANGNGHPERVVMPPARPLTRTT